MQKDKWVLITAGIGSPKYKEAANRIASEFSEFGLNVETIILCDENLAELCPSFSQELARKDLSKTKGFGYWFWKAEVIARTINSPDKSVNGVIWIDSGSEIYVSRWTRRKFLKLMKLATNIGTVTYALNTSESKYTKKEVFQHFKVDSTNGESYQFQANFFLIYGEKGKRIATQWFETIEKQPELLDDNSGIIVPGFIEHRHDQSIFSLVCKVNCIEPAISPPPTGRNGFKSIIRASLDPVWISRNRSGVTIKPKWLIKIGRLSI